MDDDKVLAAAHTLSEANATLAEVRGRAAEAYAAWEAVSQEQAAAAAKVNEAEGSLCELCRAGEKTEKGDKAERAKPRGHAQHAVKTDKAEKED